MLAFQQLLRLRLRINNKLRRGDLKTIIDGYYRRTMFCVTRQNHEYRMKLHFRGIAGLLSDNLCQHLVVNESPTFVQGMEVHKLFIIEIYLSNCKHPVLFVTGSSFVHFLELFFMVESYAIDKNCIKITSTSEKRL
jgi:hypothetical protein